MYGDYMKYSVKTVIKKNNNTETTIKYKTDSIEEVLRNINEDSKVKKEHLSANNVILQKIKDGLFSYFETTTTSAALIYLCLNVDENNNIKISSKEIQNKVGISSNTIVSAITILEELNIIKRLSNDNSGTKYFINIENLNNIDVSINFEREYFVKNVQKYIQKNITRARCGKSSKDYRNILGLSAEEFAEYLEGQFTKDINWKNRNEWHIDHIIPISKAKNIEEAEKLNHYTNLRPLLIKDNVKKSNKLENDYELFEEP